MTRYLLERFFFCFFQMLHYLKYLFSAIDGKEKQVPMTN